MCTYNGAEFLPAQWESILAQSRPPDEIVVCDDGSSDQTRSLLEQLAKESSIPVTLRFNQANLGSVKNFEQAIRLCTGEIIALSDQDDVWRNDKLQTIEETFANILRPDSSSRTLRSSTRISRHSNGACGLKFVSDRINKN